MSGSFWVLLALVAAACSGPHPASKVDLKEAPGSLSGEAREHYRRARAFWAASAVLKAAEEAEAARRLAPEWLEAHRIYIATRTGGEAIWDETIAEYEARVQAHPGDAQAHYLLAYAYYVAAREDEVETPLDEALRLDPDLAWAWLERGLLSLRQGKVEAARQAIATAREHADPDNLDLRSGIAQALYDTQEVAAALAEAEAILKRDPEYFAAYPLRWKARLSQAKNSEATAQAVLAEIRKLEAAHDEDPEALAAVKLGYLAHPDEEVQNQWWRINAQLFRLFGLDEAVGPELSFVGDPVTRPVRWRGRLAARFNRARSPFRAHEHPPASIDAQAQLATYREIDQELSEDAPRLHNLYPAMLETAQRLGDTATMAQIVERLAQAGVEAPLRKHARTLLAQAYLDSGALEQAAEQADLLLPEDFERDVAAVLAERPRPDDVGTYYTWLKGAWGLADRLDVCGQVALGRGQSVNAMRALEASVELAEEMEETTRPRDYPDYLLHLGHAYLEAGQTEPAVATLAQAYRLFDELREKAQQAEQQLEEGSEPSASDAWGIAVSEAPSRITPRWFVSELVDRRMAGVALPAWDGRQRLEADLAAIRTALAPVHRAQQPETSFAAWWDQVLQQEEARMAARKQAQGEEALISVEAAEAAPAFELVGLSGTRRQLSDHSGRVVVLNFWATWCGPCRMEYPILQKLQRDYADQGVSVVMVSIDTDRYKVPPFVAEQGLSAEILLTDGEVQGRYGVSGIPATFLIDPEGRLRYSHTGLLDEPTITAYVQALIADETHETSLGR